MTTAGAPLVRALGPSLVPALLCGAAVAVRWALPSVGLLRATRLDMRSGSRPGPVRVPKPRPLGRPAAGFLAVLSGIAVLALAGPVPAALAGIGAGLAVRAARRRRARVTAAQECGRASEACAALSAELRSGRVPAEALEVAARAAVGPSAQALRAAAAAVRLGGDVPATLTAGAARSAVPELLRGLAACWSVSASSGSGLAGGVDRIEEGLRALAGTRRLLEEELAAPRVTAGLLAVLPVFGVLLGAGLGASPVHVLFHTPIGLCCLGAGTLLDLLGLAWTSRLAARAGRSR